MKVLKVVMIIAVVFLILAAGGAYVFVKNLDLSDYKGQIARMLGSALQTEVKIGDIDFDFGLGTGLSLNVQKVELASRGLLTGVGINVEEVRLAVSLQRLFKEQLIVIEAMTVREPIIRYDMQERKKAAAGQKNNFAGVNVKTEAKGSFQNDFLQELQVNTIRVTDGEIILLQDENLLSRDLEIKDIEIVIENLLFAGQQETSAEPFTVDPFSFRISCSALGAKQALTIDGTGRADPAARQVRFDDIHIRSDISQISLEQAAERITALNAMGFEELKGIIDMTVSQIILGAGEVPVLTLNGSLRDAGISSSRIPVRIKDLNTSFEYSGSNLDILESSLHLADGQVFFKGRLEDILRTQLYQFDVTLKEINPVVFVPDHLLSGITFEGLLNGSGSFRGGGLQAADVIKNFSGEASFAVPGGKLEGLNILNVVIGKISFIPGLDQRVLDAVPQQYRERMRLNQTVFEEILMTFKINKGEASYQTNLKADTGSLKAKGRLNWKQDFLFDGDVMIPAALTQALVDDVHDLAPLIDGQTGEIVLPLERYQGPLMLFRPSLDTKYLMEKVVVTKVKQEIKGELKDILKDTIFGKDAPDQDASVESGENTQPDIVDTIFDSIF